MKDITLRAYLKKPDDTGQFLRFPLNCLWFFVCVPQVNDFVRDKFTGKDNTIPFLAEIMAGGCVSTRSQTFVYECINEQ